MVVLRADFAFGFDAIRPVDDEMILLPATVFALFEVAERCVARHGPAGVIVRVGVLAAPVLKIGETILQRGL